GQSRDRWQDAKSVCGEKDDVLRMAAHARNHCIIDVLNWISYASVFGIAGVVVIRNPRLRSKDHIFQQGAEADGMPDLRLIFLRESDRFCVATAFKIEDSRRAPAVLIVPDQSATGIC